MVYAAGLVQGVALVTFPAASSIFTSPSHYGLSTTQYGSMFLPQVVTAITASLFGARLARRYGLKRVFVAGLLADLVSMGLLVTSQFFTGTQDLAYGLLLVATAALGVGFGLVVPALNTFTAAFHPGGVDKAVLTLNALLGLGTALAPVFVALFVGVGAWWGLPIMTGVLLVGLLAVGLRLPLAPAGTTAAASGATREPIHLPLRFWLFAGFAVLYGICETMNGNWSESLMAHLGASTTSAALALTTFWVMVTLGRVLFAAVQAAFPTTRTYHLLPFVLVGTFVLLALAAAGIDGVGHRRLRARRALAVRRCLPLTISFSEEQLVAMSSLVAGAIIAFYQLGYGVAAFGAGPLQGAGVSLSAIFGFTAVLALAMGGLSFVLARRHHRVSHLHPRPALSVRAGAG